MVHLDEEHTCFKQDVCQGSKGQAADDTLLMEIIDKLSGTWCDFKKAIASASKIYDSAVTIEEPSERLAEASHSLGTFLEGADTLSSELGWVVKYKKHYDTKTPLTLIGAQDLQKRWAIMLQDILDFAKQTKAFMP